jgi:hypothetical protein
VKGWEAGSKGNCRLGSWGRQGIYDSPSYQRGEGTMANLEFLDLGDEGRGNMNGLFF